MVGLIVRSSSSHRSRRETGRALAFGTRATLTERVVSAEARHEVGASGGVASGTFEEGTTEMATRREFLSSLLSAGAMSLVAACGGAGQPQTGATSQPAKPAATTAPAAPAAGATTAPAGAATAAPKPAATTAPAAASKPASA